MGIEQSAPIEHDFSAKETVDALQVGDFDKALGSLVLREEEILSEAEEAVEGAPKVAAFTERNQLAMTMFFDKNFGNDQMAYV